MGELLFVRFLFSLLGRKSTTKRLAVEASAGSRCRFAENVSSPATDQSEDGLRKIQVLRPAVRERSYRVWLDRP
ncbi:hypothetical protein C0V73_09165 [Rhizobium sp. TH135]|nr:hypothetical protein C0V73_09165 [Rhizobium sp. TH135]